ncbi:MAG TPA: helix-turn-helix domain-containing protein [Metabacillus sp.]|nr:helix-turn-helix domain-containing protein [Metabacillus sp.]
MNIVKTLDIEYIAKLIFDSFKVPIKFIEPNGSVLYHFTSVSTINPLYSPNYFKGLIENESNQLNFPLFLRNQYLENFIIMDIQTSEKNIGKFLIGPTLTRKLPDEMINGLLHDYSKITGKQELTFYYDSLPTVNHDQFLAISNLLFFLIFNERLDMNQLTSQNGVFIKKSVASTLPDLEITRRRENQAFHPPEFYEIEMLQCIKEGRKEDLAKKLNENKPGESGILAKNSYLRSQKNMAICGITLGTRAAIEGGLEWDLARTLSDVYIQNIEETVDVESTIKISRESMYDLAERVQKNNEAKYSKVINQCFRYIYKHIYDNILITDIADFVGTSPVHLSARFKKEVGQTLKHYIQQEKVEEAKKLIILTDTSFLDICMLLNFNDQSYFTKVFKKVTGLTPKQYKDRGRLI